MSASLLASPLSQSAGPAFGFKAITSPSDPSIDSLGRSDCSPLRPGAVRYDGAFQIFPCRQSSRTPERLDSDPVLVMNLDCCSNPLDHGCGKPSVEGTLSEALLARGFSGDFMFAPGHFNGVPGQGNSSSNSFHLCALRRQFQ